MSCFGRQIKMEPEDENVIDIAALPEESVNAPFGENFGYQQQQLKVEPLNIKQENGIEFVSVNENLVDYSLEDNNGFIVKKEQHSEFLPLNGNVNQNLDIESELLCYVVTRAPTNYSTLNSEFNYCQSEFPLGEFNYDTNPDELDIKEQENESELTCYVCDEKLETRALLDLHMTSHPNHPLYCSLCDSTFRAKSSFSAHIARHLKYHFFNP